MKRIKTKYILACLLIVLGIFCVCITGRNWFPAAAHTENTVQEKIHYVPNGTNGVCYEYYKTEDGKWNVNGKKYNYRVVLNGKSPNAAVGTQFVVLTNNKNISFQEVDWSIVSSNSNDDLDPEITCLVEIR